jgi:NADPH-dependent glutamate synthase beta subunit-like oxidoreductase
MSVAWQLRQHGHEAVLYDLEKKLGGKISSLVPRSRIPDEIINAELERVREALPHIHLQQKFGIEEVEQLKEDYDFVIIAVGAQKPRILPVPGKERMIPALQFLKDSKADKAEVGKTVRGSPVRSRGHHPD